MLAGVFSFVLGDSALQSFQAAVYVVVISLADKRYHNRFLHDHIDNAIFTDINAPKRRPLQALSVRRSRLHQERCYLA